MSEAEESVSSLISPDDFHSDEIKSYLQDAGFSAGDQDWLVNVFQHPDCYGDQCDPATFKDLALGFADILPDILEKSNTPMQAETDRQTRLSLLLSSLLGLGPFFYLPEVNFKISVWIDKFQRHAGFCAKNLDVRKFAELKSHWFNPRDLLPYLFPKGILLQDIVDLDLDSDTYGELFSPLIQNDVRLEQIVNIALSKSGLRREWSIKDFKHRGGFNFLVSRFGLDLDRWLDEEQHRITRILRTKNVLLDSEEVRNAKQHCNMLSLRTVLEEFSGLPEDILGVKLHGLLNVIEYVLDKTETHKFGWFRVKDELCLFLEFVNEKQLELNLRQTALLKAWWRLSIAVHLGGHELSDDLKIRLVKSAVEHFRILRNVLRDAPEDFKDKDTKGGNISDFYESAFNILCRFASPWEQLQSLLTVFTEITTPAIPYDLSCLREWPNIERQCPANTALLSLSKLIEDEGESPFHPYCKIPMWFEDAVMRIWREDDIQHKNGVDWHELREEFAKFCLERLETERRSVWRQGYVQALGKLRVDPGGSTRNTLLRLSDHDPDELVRELAKTVHNHFDNDPHEEFPGHPLLEAFWFLRQSHRLELRPSRKDPEAPLVKQCLQEAGFSNADQAWLALIFERPDCFGDPNGLCIFKPGILGELPSALQELQKTMESEDVQTGKLRQTRLAVIFSFLLGFGPVRRDSIRPNVMHPEEQSASGSDFPVWVGKFQRHARFCIQRLDWLKLTEIERSHSFQLNHLIPFLFPVYPETIPIEQVVDFNLLDPRPKQRTREDFDDPKALEFWLTRKFRSFECHKIIRLDTLHQGFSSFPEDILGDKTLGLLKAVREAWHRANGEWKSEAVVSDELLPFFQLLSEKEPAVGRERSSLLRAWWRLSVVTSAGHRPRLPEISLRKRLVNGEGMRIALEDRKRQVELVKNKLVESAARHIGMLRALLRDTPKEFEGEDPAGPVCDFYEDAVKVLLNFGAPWECLRPLLLAFTQMTAPAVPSDLRFWHEPKRDKLPQPYSKIPLWIGTAMYPQNLRAEQERDSDLRDLREAFATWCLTRLRTKKNATNATDFVDPRPVWRESYVQALTALRVNPGARAHRTLFWLSQHEPNEKVRKRAKSAHRQIRHLDRKKSNLDEGASPRRPLFEAFWFLRQAHIITLGKEVDPAGAMRTRRKELHRSREKEDVWFMDDAEYTDRLTTS